MMTQNTSHPTTNNIYQQIREVLIQARSRALRTVNAEMVACYWQIGRLIIEEEQQGEERARYGKRLIKAVSIRLNEEFGRGSPFDLPNEAELVAEITKARKSIEMEQRLKEPHP